MLRDKNNIALSNIVILGFSLIFALLVGSGLYGYGVDYYAAYHKSNFSQGITVAQAAFEGKLTFDTMKPDGAPRKLIDISRLANMGWKYDTSLEEGLNKTYEWYINQEYREF